MALISFSIPEMLPMVLAGLADVTKETGHGVNNVLDAQLWASNEFPQEAEAWVHCQRRKRQTCRRFDFNQDHSRSPWARLERGDRLSLWWKSRTANRRFLGSAKVASVSFVRIENLAGFMVVYPVVKDLKTGRYGHRADTLDTRQFAFEDGFASLDECRDFFVPNEGDVFEGVLIKW